MPSPCCINQLQGSTPHRIAAAAKDRSAVQRISTSQMGTSYCIPFAASLDGNIPWLKNGFLLSSAQCNFCWNLKGAKLFDELQNKNHSDLDKNYILAKPNCSKTSFELATSCNLFISLRRLNSSVITPFHRDSPGAVASSSPLSYGSVSAGRGK